MQVVFLMYLQVVVAGCSCPLEPVAWEGGTGDVLAVPVLLPCLGLGADKQKINYSSTKKQTSITTDVSPNV